MKRYTESHEWVSDEGRVGITNYAQEELGEIVYVELPEVGQEISGGGEGAVLESTKAAADVYSPVSGKVKRVNTALSEAPGLVNSDADGEGWLFELELTDPSQLESLMDEASYRSMVGGR